MAQHIVGVGGYFTENDGFRHAIVARAEGLVHEIFFSSNRGEGIDRLACFEHIVGISGFFSDDDGFQHVIVGTPGGDIREIYWKPDDIHCSPPLTNISGLIAVSAFYARDDQNRIVIAASERGDLVEIYYHPNRGIFVTSPPLARFPGLVAMAAFYSDDDHYRHVIGATGDGKITEVYYHPSIGVHISQPPLATFPDVVSVGAFYTPDDGFRHVIVGTSNGDVTEVFYGPQIGVHVSQPPLANLRGLVSVAGFWTSDDGFRHVIVAQGDGSVSEIFYGPNIGSHLSQPPLAVFGQLEPAAQDVGPDVGSLTSGVASSLAGSGSPSPAGRMLRLAGDASRLYAASATAGLWRSIQGSAWDQLPVPPLDASVLAADPAGPTRVAVGTASGLIESVDGGDSWITVFDPASFAGPSSAVTAVAYGPGSLVLAGTTGGIGYRATPTGTFQFTAIAPGLGPVTAFAIAEAKLWARSPGALLSSGDGGASWSPPVAIPGAGQLRFSEIATVAAADRFAYVVSAAPGGMDPASTCGTDNLLLVYNGSQWQQQRVEFQGRATCDGTGQGSVDGRRFVSSFQLGQPGLGAGVGQRIQLFFGAGQEVYRAEGLNPDGTVAAWTRPAGTQGPGFTNQDPLHSEIWDFLVDVSAAGGTAWIATDGGVFSDQVPAPYNFPGAGWQPLVSGQHTHYGHTLTILPADPVNRPRLAYATQDNDAWLRDASPIVLPAAPWDNNDSLGDANWTDGDAGSPQLAFLARRLAGWTQLTAFGAGLPIGAGFQEGQRLTVNNDESFSGPLGLRFIQTPAGAAQFPLLDVAMLVNLPLSTLVNGQLTSVPGQLGQPSPNGAPVLIRTRAFAANPDANQSQFQNWTVESTGLPAGTRGFYVSGGHDSPVYYLFTVTSTGITLYRRQAGPGFWEALPVSGLVLTGESLGPAFLGPAFPNPYVPGELYVATRAGIQHSVNSGSDFVLDRALTRLVTRSGTRPVTNLSHIAFDLENPRRAAAAAGSSGVFYRDEAGTWHDLTSFLPSPLSPVLGSGIDCEAVYALTNGRGLLRVVGYVNA